MIVVRPVICGVLLAGWVPAVANEPAARPYELDWAGRNEDFWPPHEDFETSNRAWRVECREAEARFERARTPRIWGESVGRLTYRGTGPRAEVRLLCDPPITVTGGFDAVTLWCYGNAWGWRRDPSTPNVALSVLLRDRAGRVAEIGLGRVTWQEWHLLHRRLDPAQIDAFAAGGELLGLRIAGGTNAEERTLAFDNLGVHREAFEPLTFKPRPARNLEPWPGQLVGLNTGPGRLPFPTREETIIPTNLTADFAIRTAAEGDTAVFTYEGADGRLVWRIEPADATWSGIRATWRPPRPDGSWGDPVSVRPCVGGGARLAGSRGASAVRTERLGVHFADGVATQRWRLSDAVTTQDLVYAFRPYGKALAVDVLAPGGGVAEVVAGEFDGPPGGRLVTLPYYRVKHGRPAVAVFGPPEAPLFAAMHVDWYRSNASELWAPTMPEDTEVRALYGGARYLPRTDGRRNDVFERFVLIVTPIFDEALPIIPNPPSPWKHVTGTRVWRAHAASDDRSRDHAFWSRMHRLGLTEMVVTDHETMWRDGGESFTFRTRAAPRKGGDEAQFAYTRFMIDRLGYVYGPYNNFTDLAPVNEFFSPDMVVRFSDRQWQPAWFRCWAPKPARAVEFCERLAPEIQRKFRFNTAYCDVHTCVAPWERTDYDARVPGAGTFSATFYAYGEIMLLQKAAWNGPVYSEGGYHAFYAGLTDGNYAQDQTYRPAENPWLVDFDLRRIHPLQCDFGMGNLDMFFSERGMRAGLREEHLDRFLAATAAFGHSGFLVTEGGERNALRSYAMTLPLHRRYCLADAADILYADADGRFEPTSRAVASGAYLRSQVAVRYSDGTCVVANGHRSARLRGRVFGRDVDLPPNGFIGWTEDGTVEVIAADRGGARADYAAAPDLIYLDGRGSFVRFPKAAGIGPALCRRAADGAHEVILPFGGSAGFAVPATRATALDADRNPIGPAELRRSRGFVWVMPVTNALSYRLELDPAAPTPPEPNAERFEVVPGERVRVTGSSIGDIVIPTDAPIGRHLWMSVGEGWLDFLVVAPFEASIRLEDDHALTLSLESRCAEPVEGTVAVGSQSGPVRLEPGRLVHLRHPAGPPAKEGWRRIPIEIAAGSWRLATGAVLIAAREHRSLVELPPRHVALMRLRGAADTALDPATGAHVDRSEDLSCGGDTRAGLFMHPPYRGAVGAAAARFGPIALPPSPAAAFRARVGKRDGSDPGDGIRFQVEVAESGATTPTTVADLHVTRHEWRDLEADLSRWAGRTIFLTLISDVGPADNSVGDWACWADLRVETLVPQMSQRLAAGPAELEREPAPPADISAAELRTAPSCWLVYEGKGFEGTGRYESRAELNGVDLGPMRPAHGDERAGRFSEPIRMPLPREAIATLGARNRLRVRSVGGDHFSLRRFRIELEWPDGRRAMSDLAAATWSQPPGWPHAEGIRVPAGEPIELDLWFDVSE